MALAQPREDREEDDPMKHRPTALAELRTKSFAATGALVSCSSLCSDTFGMMSSCAAPNGHVLAVYAHDEYEIAHSRNHSHTMRIVRCNSNASAAEVTMCISSARHCFLGLAVVYVCCRHQACTSHKQLCITAWHVTGQSSIVKSCCNSHLHHDCA